MRFCIVAVNILKRNSQSSEFRFITIIGLVQAGLILLFWGITSVHLKALGYPDFETGLRWNPYSLFVREWAILLFVIPALWAAGALIVEQNEHWNVPRASIFALGFGITVILFVFLLTNSFEVSTRPIILFRE